MKTSIITCETLRSELQLAQKQYNTNFDIIWLESGLHEVPKNLHSLLQSTLDNISDSDRVLLALGRCGGALNGLRSRDYEMILPKVDDCISLFFGSDKGRYQYADKYAAIYLTEGWARGELSILKEYNKYVDEYDEETAQDLIEMLYGNFRTLALLDTGAYSVEKLAKKSKATAKICNLEQRIVPATLSYIGQLLTGSWDKERFYVVGKNSELIL